MTTLREMKLISTEEKYQHGEGLFVYVHRENNNTATVWIDDRGGTSIPRDLAYQYVKLLAPGAAVQQRGTTYEVTPLSALYGESPPCSS